MGANCTSAPLRASTGVSPGFALPPPRSPGFGSHSRDYRPFQTPPLAGITRLRACRFPYAFGVKPLKLATAVNSPARVSRRTVRPRSPLFVLPGHPGFLRVVHPFQAAPCLAAWFQALFTPLPGYFSAFPHGT